MLLSPLRVYAQHSIVNLYYSTDSDPNLLTNLDLAPHASQSESVYIHIRIFQVFLKICRGFADLVFLIVHQGCTHKGCDKEGPTHKGQTQNGCTHKGQTNKGHTHKRHTHKDDT